MKKLILALSVLMTAMTPPAFANEETNVDPRVLSAFQKDFSLAKDVKWELKTSLSFAKFTLYDQSFTAWYNAEAKLVSTARVIFYKQLPLSVVKSLEEKYRDAIFSSMLEVTKDNETNYYVRVETSRKKILVKADAYGNLSVKERVKI